MLEYLRQRINVPKSPKSPLRVAGGAANFFLMQWRGRGSLDRLLGHLLQQGIAVRDCRNFAGLEENFFRFAIRTPRENDLLLEAFRAVLEKTEDG